MDGLNPLGAQGGCFNVVDQKKFNDAIKLLKESLFDGGATFFCSDNVITWNRNYSFLRDPFFVKILQSNNATNVEKSIVWRTYILLYFANFAAQARGDFVELGCHTGYTAHEVLRKLNLCSLGKKYFLYDLFEWKEGDEHTLLEGHKNPNMYEDVVRRFADYPCVKIIKGSVPDSFSQEFPDEISFCHIDMNHPVPETGALKEVLPRLQKGGVVVFDDYGWWGYSAQKIGLDPIAAAHGLEILELPTGQGVLLKP